MINISLFEMSVKGAFFIILIIIIRSLLINILPKKTFIALWLVALYLLLIPISIPSKFSIYTFIENYIGNFNKYQYNDFSVVNSPNNISQELFLTDKYISPLVIVWIIGFILSLIFFLVLYLRFQWKVKTSMPIYNEYINDWLAKHTLKRTVNIRQSAEISSPLTYGIFKPVILMPKSTDWTDINSLQYIITHEYIHIKRLDLLTKFILTLALCVHWFNPLVWTMYILANRDIELVCDECVLQEFGINIRSSYANILINMEERKIGLTPFSNNFSKNSVEERIIAIMKTKKKTLFTSLIAAVIVIGSATVFATSAQAKPNIFTRNDRTNCVYDLTKENAGIRYRDYARIFDNEREWCDDCICENNYRQNGSGRYRRGEYGKNRYSRNNNGQNYRYNRYNRGCQR